MAKTLLDDASEGWTIGQSSTSLVGFWGKTPVDQPAAVASCGSVATSLKTTLNAVIARLRESGLIAT